MKFRAIVEIEGETLEDLETTLDEIKERQVRVVNEFGLAIHRVKVTGEELEYKDVKLI